MAASPQLVAAVLPASCKTLILETWADQSSLLFHVVVWRHPITISEQLLGPKVCLGGTIGI